MPDIEKKILNKEDTFVNDNPVPLLIWETKVINPKSSPSAAMHANSASNQAKETIPRKEEKKANAYKSPKPKDYSEWSKYIN